jgi:hypothetical protein
MIRNGMEDELSHAVETTRLRMRPRERPVYFAVNVGGAVSGKMLVEKYGEAIAAADRISIPHPEGRGC